MFSGTPQAERERYPVGEGEEYELRPGDAPMYDLEHDAKIIGWRADCFMALGFSHLRALALALRRDVDRAHVERLVRAGATLDQASLIVR